MGWLLALVFFVLWLVALNDRKGGAAKDFEQGKADTIERPGPVPVRQQAPELIAQTAPPPVVRARVVTAAERQAATLRNLNTVLYAASFLLVAACVAFIFTGTGPVAKLMTLLTVTAAFYSGGLILHAYSRRLRPAAAAFMGTGLATFPFTGVALSAYGGVASGVSWLLVSLVGLGLYAAATRVLRSSALAYLTLAFVLSLCLSVVNTTDVGFVWYFVVLVIAATLAALASAIWPRRLGLYTRPVSLTGQALTPLTLAASLVAQPALSIELYELIFAVTALSYIVIWLQRRTYWSELIARIALHVSLVVFVLGLHPSSTALALWLIAISAIHAVISVRLIGLGGVRRREHETASVIANGGVMFIASFITSGSAYAPHIFGVALTVIGALAFAVAFRLRDSRWAYVSLVVSLIVPLILARGIIDPAVDWAHVSDYFMTVALGASIVSSLALRRRRTALAQLATTGFIGYIAVAGLCALLFANAWFTAMAALVLAGLILLQSSISRAAWAELIASLLGLVATGCAASQLDLPMAWQPPVTALLAAGLIGALMAVHVWRASIERLRYVLVGLIIALTYGAGALVFDTFATNLTVLFAFLVLAKVALLVRLRFVHDRVTARLLVCAYYLFAAIVAASALVLQQGWQTLALAIVAGMLFVGSHADRARGLIIGANVFVLAALGSFVDLLNVDDDVRAVAIGGAFVVLMLLADTLYYYAHDGRRQWYVLGSLWTVAGWTWLTHGFDDQPLGAVAAGIGAVGGLSLVLHGYELRRRTLIEAGIYVTTLALQWIVGRTVPGLDATLYAYWWAITILCAGYGLHRHLRPYVACAMAIITADLGLYALAGRDEYALAFLIQHVGFIIVGFALAKRWIIWWGIIATILSVLYFLRSYTYLWLGLLGLLLIGFVVWRLARSDHKES